MKFIKLTKGLRTKVDNEVFKWAGNVSWYALNNGNGRFYAARDVKKSGKRQTILLHRQILGLLDFRDGEHKNGDSLDNQIHNLRPATRSQNHANRIRLPENKSSKYRGVSRHHRGGWTAQISINNRKKHLGMFASQRDAAICYDEAARKQFGQFARPNFSL